MSNQTIRARVITNNTINAGITPEANINANIKSSSSINASIGAIASASTERKGVIRIATNEEAIDGNADNIAITPYTLRLVTTYTHTQGSASNVWVINHNLNKNPSVTIIDSSGNIVNGRVKYINENTVEVYFNSSFKGSAYLN
jgi:hypothetical protein